MKIALFLVTILIIGLFVVNSNSKKSDCEIKGLEAAVEWYPISDYPDTAERQRLQKEYQNRYVETCIEIS